MVAAPASAAVASATLSTSIVGNPVDCSNLPQSYRRLEVFFAADVMLPRQQLEYTRAACELGNFPGLRVHPLQMQTLSAYIFNMYNCI